VEIVVPCTAFSILFVAFIWQIVSRYGFNQPISWSNEVQVFGYMWTVLPGAGYVMRKKRHVAFTVLYDLFNPRVQRIVRIAANSILGVTYGVLLPYAIRFVASDTTITAVFRVSRRWFFASLILFVLTAIGYSLYDVYEDCRDIIQGRPPVDHRLTAKEADEKKEAGE
jgi:TRAP-type C4-dicarboxylate transport system permease small subunit